MASRPQRARMIQNRFTQPIYFYFRYQKIESSLMRKDSEKAKEKQCHCFELLLSFLSWPKSNGGTWGKYKCEIMRVTYQW